MSVAKKEEVCSHRLGLRLVEPAVGVPIKKRPVLVSDKSVPSGVLLSMKPSSPETGMSVSAAGAGCSKESFLNRSKSDTNVIAKGKGTTNSRDQNHANRSFMPSVTEKKGVLVNGSSEIPSCGESDRGSVAPVDESQSHKFLTLDLRLASCWNGKINYSSVVEEEKVDQGFSVFPTAEPPKDIQTSEMKSSSDSSFGKLPNLDLNVPLDPVDSLEGLSTMHEGSNKLHHRTVEHQKAQVPLVAQIYTISGRLSRNIDSTLNLSNAYGLSDKRGAADVTLDLQLKPPARPELGINWKGLAPAPELSLSLFGKHTDEPKDPSVPDAVVKSEPVGSAKNISGEVATPGSDKSPVEKIAKPVPCNANPQRTSPSTVSGNEKQPSSSKVKKEPEEPFHQLNQNNVEKAPLFEQQSVGLVSNCAEFEKTEYTHQVLGKSGFDLNSEIFPNNSIHNGLEVATDSVPVRTDRLHDVVRAQTMPAVPEVNKFIKREEITTAIPSPVIVTESGQPVPSIAKSLPLEGNVASPAVGLCELASQPPICTSERACCNPDEAAADCKPTVSHVHAHEDVTCKPCDGNKACDVSRSSSNPTAEALVFNSRNHAAFDGMSQGSAEMDCSDGDDNTISQLPTTNKPHIESLGNSQITEANSLCTELQKEHNSDTHQDCSSVTNKVHMQGVDDDKRIDTKGGIVTHSGEEGHQNEVFVDGKFKDKQLLTPDKNSPMNNTDVAMQDVKIATGFSSTDLRRSSALGTSASPKIESTRQSHKACNNSLEKSRSPEIKSKRSQSPHGKQAADCSEDHAKNAAIKSEHGTESEEVVRESDLHPKDLVLGENSHLDGASSSQPHNECTKAKSASERSEYEKSKPDSCRTSSVQNERDGQVDGSHWRDAGYAYVNRNERWERFMESEGEKNKGEYQGVRHASDMINQRRTDHRYGGRGAGSRGHPRNFRGPRMNNESEIAFADEPIIGRRRPFEDDLGHLHRIPHRRRRSPPTNNQMPGCLVREMDLDRFSGREIHDPRHGQIEDIPDDMMEDNFFIPHSRPQHAQGDHGFIHRERGHSPVQRRGAPMHFHRGRSPEAMRRSPPLIRTDRPYAPHRRHTRRHGSPFDRIGHDERGMQRNMRRCGVHQGVEGDTFEPPLHPAQLAELDAEAELTERRKFGDRRAYLRSLEESPVGDEEDMLSYHGEGDMGFAEGGGGPRELEGRFRSRLEHRARGEQEDGYRYRGPEGWRDGNSNGSRPKRRY